ncbi:MAG: hypothetical protein JNM53_12135, partial [Gemmatimonadetes bacterium]|nr:hypothetical protein [Gemmatimonadota bacterium]
VFGNESESGARLAMRLLREGFKVGAATEQVVAGSTAYPRGTFIVRLQRNPVEVHERIAALATELGVPVTPVQSGFPDSGQYGVGSETVMALRAPRILLAAGDGVDQTSFGALWFYFERELGIPVIPVNLATLSWMNLGDYNTLIIPEGSAGRMWRELGEGGARRLKTWVEEGAAVIALGDAVGLLGRKELGLTTASEVTGDSTAPKDTTVAAGQPIGPPLVSPSAAGGNRPEFIPGSIFRGTLDRSHWLTFGYERDQLPVFLETSTLLKPSEKGANPVAFTGTDLLLSGWTWPENTEKHLRNSVYAAVESAGGGQVVLFAGNPVYRGFWRGTARLLTNAVLMAPQR